MSNSVPVKADEKVFVFDIDTFIFAHCFWFYHNFEMNYFVTFDDYYSLTEIKQILLN